MIPDPVGWFAMGATFGLVLCGWPWHPRFSRYKPRRMGPPRGSYGLPPDHDWRRISGLGEPSPPQGDWMDEAFPLPPPDVMDAINRQLDRDIAAEVARRSQGRGANPPIKPKPQRPPLGLKPRWLADEQRLQEVADAINRYREAGVAIPLEWLDEYDELGRRLQHSSLPDDWDTIIRALQPVDG